MLEDEKSRRMVGHSQVLEDRDAREHLLLVERPNAPNPICEDLRLLGV